MEMGADLIKYLLDNSFMLFVAVFLILFVLKNYVKLHTELINVQKDFRRYIAEQNKEMLNIIKENSNTLKENSYIMRNVCKNQK